MQAATSAGQPVGGRVQRLRKVAPRITALASLILLFGWGLFAVTTIVPNPDDQPSVYGAFQSTHLFQWPPNSDGPDHHNIPPGSTIVYVFEIAYIPNGGGGCEGYASTSARNGTIVASCNLPTPNSTLTSGIRDYLTFNIRNDPKCCQQTYFSWLSGPSGNLTGDQRGGGFFEVDQPGNYSFHISNTNMLPPPAFRVGYVNGTLTFGDGYVLFTHPYFLAGIATLVVAIAVAGFSVFSLSQRRSRRPPGYRETPLSKEMSD